MECEEYWSFLANEMNLLFLGNVIEWQMVYESGFNLTCAHIVVYMCSITYMSVY